MKKIALFGHDAGGSELILELASASSHVGEFHIFCTEDSPCFTLAKQKNLQKHLHIIQTSKESIFKELGTLNPSLILYSTGWQNHIEYNFLAYAKEFNIPSIAFLDHWVNYRERFGYPAKNWEENLPDYIAVHDQKSEELATSLGLPNIIAIKNYALLSQLKNLQNTNLRESETLLFLSEPTAKVAQSTFKDSYYWGFDEKDVFESILKYKTKLHCKDILVRLHPSDNPELYKEIYPEVKISTNSLSSDIASAKVVIGIDTIALRLAFLMGKKVIAFIPSKNRDFCVPLPKQNQVRSLSDLDIGSLPLSKENAQDFGIEFAVFVEKIIG